MQAIEKLKKKKDAKEAQFKAAIAEMQAEIAELREEVEQERQAKEPQTAEAKIEDELGEKLK